jgi:hypothetical protein
MPSSKESRAMRDLLFKQQDGRCFWCGKRCYQRYSAKLRYQHNNFTLDHVRPKAEGGRKRDPGGTVGACERCNRVRNLLFGKLKFGHPIDHVLFASPELKRKLVESIEIYVDKNASTVKGLIS